MDKHKNAVPTEQKMRRSAQITVIFDIIIIMSLMLCLLLYILRNNDNTYNQNVNTVTNISMAEAEYMRAAFNNASDEVRSAYKYCSGRELEDVLEYLSVINTTDGEFQMLKYDEINSTDDFNIYNGYSTAKDNGVFKQIRYEDTALSKSLFSLSSEEAGKVSLSRSFTNRIDGIRYFAAFCSIEIKENGVPCRYYLLKPQKESMLLDQLRMYSQYDDLSIAVCYTDGKYLACDTNFRANNFYDYLYDYNDLSIDERNKIKQSVQNDSDGTGVLEYRDLKGRDCIFTYAICEGSENWIIVVSLPLSEFVSEKLLSFFPLIIISFLLILLVFNITRLLIIVKELRLSIARERVANTAKSSFLSRMSHEIRTPLNAIIGYNIIAGNELETAKTDDDLKQNEKKVKDCLEKSGIASRHLLTIINDVLDMSAIESGKVKVSQDRFDFRGMITSLTTVFYSQAKSKGVNFEVIFNTMTAEWFIGDQMRTNQILTNLLSNAIKFTPEGGKVTLKIYQPDAENASHIHFEVADTGIGMTPEYLSRIWTPFEQADSTISRRFGGTGLGLSITKNLVDLMNGKISVSSTPGVGTVFNVELVFEISEQPAYVISHDFSRINALIVDDDVSTCDYIRLLFNSYGAKCASVNSGKDALKAISVSLEQGEPYNMCLIDWQMPEMDGIETIKRIRDILGEELPIFILTAYDYTEIADYASEAGVNKFISKPLFKSTLFDLLADISGCTSEKAINNENVIDFKGVQILLAEDNAMNMEIAKTILCSAGLSVDTAWNGREAVEMFTASPSGKYKAILMDVHMPEMSGYEATQAIRASSKSDAKTIPIIAMTADAFAENVAEALASGMNDHIAKPIDIGILFETLNKFVKAENK